jgi:hypothetical protein
MVDRVGLVQDDRGILGTRLGGVVGPAPAATEICEDDLGLVPKDTLVAGGAAGLHPHTSQSQSRG